MTYEEAQKHARAGKSLRHPKMGEGWFMVHERGRFICRHPSYTGRSSPDAEDRLAKNWEVVS